MPRRKKPVEMNPELDHALWWVSRWVSGSMTDPDWSWPEAETMDVERAFEIVQANIGNARSTGVPLWRYICVSDEEAGRLDDERTLLPHANTHQSFTAKREIALEFGEDGAMAGDAHVLVCVEVPAADVMFGMADLAADRRADDVLRTLDLWHHQEEVIVRVREPVRILEVVHFEPGAGLEDGGYAPGP